jgi:hypothetical protein
MLLALGKGRWKKICYASILSIDAKEVAERSI